MIPVPLFSASGSSSKNSIYGTEIEYMSRYISKKVVLLGIFLTNKLMSRFAR